VSKDNEKMEGMLEAHSLQDAVVQKEILERLAAIEGSLKQYQGFRNGAIAVIVVFWTVVATFGKELLSWLRG
jgi:hypothetical protein